MFDLTFYDNPSLWYPTKKILTIWTGMGFENITKEFHKGWRTLFIGTILITFVGSKSKNRRCPND